MVPFCELATRDATQITVNSADAHKYGLRKHPWHYRHFWKLKFLCAGIFFLTVQRRLARKREIFLWYSEGPQGKPFCRLLWTSQGNDPLCSASRGWWLVLICHEIQLVGNQQNRADICVQLTGKLTHR